MSFNPYLHHEYLRRTIPGVHSRCRRCGGGPVINSLTGSDHCLNCRNHLVSQPFFRFGDVVSTIKRVIKKFTSVFRGMLTVTSQVSSST